MTISIDNFIYLARQQEQRKFPRILACGVAGSLVLHSMAAVALNYFPQQMPVEVTLIDPSEIPADLRPSPKPPKPIPKKKIAKVTPTPTPSLTPTPSVKITPTPIPTPSVKITPTPTPTPSVKAKPNLTPQVVNIVMKPATPTLATKAANDFEKGHNQTRNLLQKNPNQQFQSAINPNEKQVKSKPDRNSGTLLQRDAVSSPLNNTRLAFKDPNRSAKLNDLLRTEPDSSAGSGSGNDQPDNVSSPGNGNSSQAATPGNLAAKNFDSTASESNSQSLTAGRNGRSPLAGAQSSGTFGDSASGGDNSELTFNSPGGLGGSPVSGGSVGGKKVNSLPLASAGTGKSGEVFNSGGVGDSFASDEFGVALIPDNGRRGSQSISEGNAKNNGNGLPLASARTGKLGSDSNSSGAGEIAGDEGFGIALSPGGRRGSQSAPGARGSGGQLAYGQIGGRGLGKVGEAESDVGNGGDDGSLSGSNLGNLSRSRSSGIFRGGKAKGFGSGLECENDCSPVNKTVALNYSIKVSADITLNDSGKVIRVNLPNPSDNVELNNFTKDAFGKMKFKLPVSVTRRVFSVELNFQKTSYH